MTTSRIIARALITVLAAVSADTLVAQSGAAKAEWETLARAPFPSDLEPNLHVNGLTMPAQPVAEHSHPGPVVGYILEGEIENQVEPDPPAIYKPGGFFVEAPRQVHKMMRNLGPQPAKLIIFGAGRTSVPAPLTRVLTLEPTKLVLPPQFVQWLVPLPTAQNQQVRLLRLTLPAGARAEAPAHSGPGLIYIVQGSITTAGTAQPRTHGAGDLFLDPANQAGLTFSNSGGSQPATLLMYHVSEQGGSSR